MPRHERACLEAASANFANELLVRASGLDDVPVPHRNPLVAELIVFRQRCLGLVGVSAVIPAGHTTSVARGRRAPPENSRCGTLAKSEESSNAHGLQFAKELGTSTGHHAEKLAKAEWAMQVDTSFRDEDVTFVGCAEAASRLGLTSTEAVRLLIKGGKLPAVRARSGYNAPYKIPEGALDQLVFERHSRRAPDPPSSPRSPSENTGAGDLEHQLVERQERLHELEDVVGAIRSASEHARRAYELHRAAFEEMAKANVILEDALTAKVVPANLRGMNG